MKKFFVVFYSLCAFLAFTACSNNDTDTSSKPIQRNSQSITYTAGTYVYEINNDIGDNML